MCSTASPRSQSGAVSSMGHSLTLSPTLLCQPGPWSLPWLPAVSLAQCLCAQPSCPALCARVCRCPRTPRGTGPRPLWGQQGHGSHGQSPRLDLAPSTALSHSQPPMPRPRSCHSREAPGRCDSSVGTWGWQRPCSRTLTHPGAGGCAGVGAQRREPTRATCRTNGLPVLPAPCHPAVYAVHNLSEVSLTQYELDSKSPESPLPRGCPPRCASLPSACPCHGEIHVPIARGTPLPLRSCGFSGSSPARGALRCPPGHPLPGLQGGPRSPLLPLLPVQT